MRPLTEILGMVTSLAAGNNTEELLLSVLSFIKYYYQEFQYDYVPCKNILNGRFKKGKLEEVLIYLQNYVIGVIQMRICEVFIA